MASSTLTVTTRQRYRATPATVFRAFSEPALLEQWFSPEPATRLEVLAYSLHMAGRYRFRYHHPGGGSDVVTGTFREVSPPKRLVFTWTWEPPDPHAGIDTLVTIELEADGDETVVVVIHERFPDSTSKQRHQSGWESTLPRLCALLA